MEKIYGYKEKDVLGLAQFILERKNQTLTQSFLEYGEKNGKAKGTVRNLYYALAKKSNVDQEFCQKYLGGIKFKVGKIVEFDKCEEEELIKKILKEKLSGKSVRSVINELANGDEKTALRYQNKFRNFIKKNPQKTKEFTAEFLSNLSQPTISNYNKDAIFKEQIKQLKTQINLLVEKISLSLRKENEKLRAKNAFLEGENAKLRQELNKNDQSKRILSFFAKKDGNRVFS